MSSDAIPEQMQDKKMMKRYKHLIDWYIYKERHFQKDKAQLFVCNENIGRQCFTLTVSCDEDFGEGGGTHWVGLFEKQNALVLAVCLCDIDIFGQVFLRNLSSQFELILDVEACSELFLDWYPITLMPNVQEQMHAV